MICILESKSDGVCIIWGSVLASVHGCYINDSATQQVKSKRDLGLEGKVGFHSGMHLSFPTHLALILDHLRWQAGTESKKHSEIE